QRDLLLAPASAAQIAAAQASVAQAQASLDQLQRDPPAWQITQAEVQLAQAQISLQRAEQDLANATLVAPFAGVVTAVSVAEGEVASGILVELVDSASLEVVLDVDEIDLANITVGQPAVVTLESWPDTPIDSEVTAVAPQAAQSPGSALVTYDVSLSLAATDLPVRIGMTANASLVTDARTDVLLVPNSAITIDRTTGRAAVYVVQADGTVVETAVSIGLRDAQHTQIVSGLNAGDRVRLNYTPPAQEDGGFGPPGGGGGPFGG
ncbi:MAG: efflux RND transporter periplasmic adaptor subunit, partial [Anaerolineales bacterium]|nr:efflux RND transporter periplasmic adaptor subunit [Anaerolineales bacterium]